MRFSQFFLPLAIAPLALAAPEPAPVPNPVAAPAPDSTGLLSELPTILSGVQELLSQDTITKLETIIDGAAKLLSSDNIVVLQDILGNAHTLLTKEFVDNTTTLIGDATPVCLHFLKTRIYTVTNMVLVISLWRMFLSFWVVCWAHYKRPLPANAL